MPTEFADQLATHGIQVTVQRVAVLKAVTGAPHATAEAITAAVRAELGAISRQGVYDALRVLGEVGLIRRIAPIGSAARYETRVGDNHHHIVCRSCGAIVDVDCAVGFTPCLTASDTRGYDIDEAEVAYLGRCPSCCAAGTDPDQDLQSSTAN